MPHRSQTVFGIPGLKGRKRVTSPILCQPTQPLEYVYRVMAMFDAKGAACQSVTGIRSWRLPLGRPPCPLESHDFPEPVGTYNHPGTIFPHRT